jgi:hypothetical protein
MVAENLITGNTIFPYIKPFMTKTRSDLVFGTMVNGDTRDKSAYRMCGLPRSDSPKWQYLRFCEDCWKDDIHLYGEPYWHRMHLLPGILVCPVHGTPIRNSAVFQKDIDHKFHAASIDLIATAEPPAKFDADITEKLFAAAQDSAWIMHNSDDIGYSDRMISIYDKLLRSKGYRCLSGQKTKNTKLYSDICDFYGINFLQTIGAYSEGFIPWTQQIMHKRNSLLYPMYYILLMRFLAGSAEQFYMVQHEENHPYGRGPWPCRNPVCPYYLQDVIEKLPLRHNGSRHHATFICPKCGFTYSRCTPIPKSEQYSGKINVVDHGHLWTSTIKDLFADEIPISRIMKTMQCEFRTVISLGVEYGYFSENRMPTERVSTQKSEPKSHKKKVYSRSYCRKQWNAAIAKAPHASRSELIRDYPMIHEWLRKNDLNWYEANSPESHQFITEWSKRDEKILEKARTAVAYLLNLPSRPIWVNRRSIEKYGGIGNLYRNLGEGRLPKTKKYLDQVLETGDDWRKRKIRWAVSYLHEKGENLLLPKIMITSSISRKMFDNLTDFAIACIEEISSIK